MSARVVEPAVDWLVPAVIPDVLVPVEAVDLGPDSFLGRRVAGNHRRLLDVDLEPRLAGFRQRPGAHAWIGEHIGKWIHAATITWARTGDPALRSKLDEAVRELIATQESDGYLGTYVRGERFGAHPVWDWDVWVHKYVLIGLLTYHRYTGEAAPLEAARRAADLMVRVFMDEGGDIVSSGTHTGLAPTSVLEPVVQLYRLTAAPRYLAFAEHIVASLDGPGGPGMLSTLLSSGRVAEVGNGKAYEMLSVVLGLVDLARATGERRYLEAAVRAWDDVVAHHLYVTGTASFTERFHRPDELPDSGSVDVGETCVTVTWLQLSRALLAVTGRQRFAAEVERTLFNQLAGAQAPDGSAWCYYAPLNGSHVYGSGISCCISSGPRGMALAPASVLATMPDGKDLVVTLYQDAHAVARLDGHAVGVRLRSGAPFRGGAELTFAMDGVRTFGIRLRIPEWSTGFSASPPGDVEDGWLVIPPGPHRDGDRVRISFGVGSREVTGTAWNAGRVAVAWGPLVLAYRAPERGSAAAGLDELDRGVGIPPIGSVAAVPWRLRNQWAPGGELGALIGPYSDLPADGEPVRVWLGDGVEERRPALFHGIRETTSGGDPRLGSATDGDPHSFAIAEADADGWAWVALEGEPQEVASIVFAHGRSLDRGGWFDTSHGRPRVQVRTAQRADWETVGELTDYPSTDAAHAAGPDPGRRFTLTLPEPRTVGGIRVIGRGSYGVRPPVPIVTCSELSAHARTPA